MHRRRLLSIPFTVLLLFSLLARAGDATTEPDAPPGSPERLATEARFREGMRRPINIDVKAVSLERALTNVSRQAMVPIKVEWDNPFDARPGGEISLSLQNVPADRVLGLILRCGTDARGDAEPKVYVDADGAHIVPNLSRSEPEPPVKSVEVRYDVADLVRAAGVGGRANEDGFDDLQRLIESTIAADSWMDNGGQVGKLSVAPLHPAPRTAADDPDAPQRGGSDARDPLVITTTPAIHAEVVALLSSLRGAMAGRPPAMPAPVVRTNVMLQRPIPATFRLLPLVNVLDSVRRSARINLFVDWRALSASGITPETVVTTPVPPQGMLTAAEALSAVLNSITEREHVPMSFDIDKDGVVEVGQTSQAAEQEVITCCYNIRGLLQTRMPSKLWPADASIDARAESISRELEQQVSPDSWRENGGQIGGIKVLGRVLVVTHTPLNQERVAEVLQRLP